MGIRGPRTAFLWNISDQYFEFEPIEISPSGYGIHFPKLDADLYLPALLEGFLGPPKWMAARLEQAHLEVSPKPQPLAPTAHSVAVHASSPQK